MLPIFVNSVPIVFYNGSKPWTAVRELKNYQMEGSIFGEYVLNLKYYLIDLNTIDEQYILSTNTLIDNIMYCDKCRQRAELINALEKAFERVAQLGRQQQKQFEDWVRCILLTICRRKLFRSWKVQKRRGTPIWHFSIIL